MKNTLKNKTNKNWKKTWTTYYLGCKDYTHNFKAEEVKMTNKVLREKSKCVVCRLNKSGFLKQKHNNKNRQIIFSNYKTCIYIVKSVINIQVIHFQKN